MRIAIFGSYGVLDSGDDAMLYYDLDYMISSGIKREDIKIITRGFEDTLMYIGELGFTSNNLIEESNMDDAIQWCDKVLITGGGTINTREDGSARSLARTKGFVDRCRNNNKPVFMSGQTIGPLGINEAHDRDARNLIDYCTTTVRDFKLSKKYAGKVGADVSKIHETVDDAWGLRPSGVVTVPKIKQFLDAGNVVGFNANNYALTSTDEYAELASDVCNDIIEKYDKNILFIHQGLKQPYNDIDVSKKIVSLSRYKDRMLCVDFAGIGCRELKEIISRLDCLVASRYHSLVFAASSGIPFVGVCADHYSWVKQIGFSDKIGCSSYIIPTPEVTKDKVLDTFGYAVSSSYDNSVLNSVGDYSMNMFMEFIK